jgi:hypothetical protein
LPGLEWVQTTLIIAHASDIPQRWQVLPQLLEVGP